MTRPVSIAPAALAFLLALGACASSGTGGPSSAESRRGIAREVLRVMDAHGLPVQSDHIGCSSVSRGGTVTCYGDSALEPQDPVVGVFVPEGSGRGGADCPGALTVSLGAELIAQTRANPCR